MTQALSPDEWSEVVGALEAGRDDVVRTLRAAFIRLDSKEAQSEDWWQRPLGAANGSVEYVLERMLETILGHAAVTGVLEHTLTYGEMADLCAARPVPILAEDTSIESRFSAMYPVELKEIGSVPLGEKGELSVELEVSGTHVGRPGRPRKKEKPRRGLRLTVRRNGEELVFGGAEPDSRKNPFAREVASAREDPKRAALDRTLANSQSAALDAGRPDLAARLARMRAPFARLTVSAMVMVFTAIVATAAVVATIWIVVRFFQHPQKKGKAMSNPPAWRVEHASWPVTQPGCLGQVDGYLDASQATLLVFTPTDCPADPLYPSVQWRWRFTETGRVDDVVTDQPTVIHRFASSDRTAWGVAVWPAWYTEQRSDPFAVDDAGVREAPTPGGPDAANVRPMLPTGSALDALIRRFVPDPASVRDLTALPVQLGSLSIDGDPCGRYAALLVPLDAVLDAQVVLFVAERGEVLPDAQVRLGDLGAYPPALASYQLYLFGLRGVPGVTSDVHVYAAKGNGERVDLMRGSLACL